MVDIIGKVKKGFKILQTNKDNKGYNFDEYNTNYNDDGVYESEDSEQLIFKTNENSIELIVLDTHKTNSKQFVLQIFVMFIYILTIILSLFSIYFSGQLKIVHYKIKYFPSIFDIMQLFQFAFFNYMTFLFISYCYITISKIYIDFTKNTLMNSITNSSSNCLLFISLVMNVVSQILIYCLALIPYVPSFQRINKKLINEIHFSFYEVIFVFGIGFGICNGIVIAALRDIQNKICNKFNVIVVLEIILIGIYCYLRINSPKCMRSECNLIIFMLLYGYFLIGTLFTFI
jgi:hypothetical protein